MRHTPALTLALLLAVTPIVSSAEQITTDAASYTEPSFENYKPQKVALVVNDAPEAARKAIEKALVDALGQRGVLAVPQAQLATAKPEVVPDSKLTVGFEARNQGSTELKANAALTKAGGDTKIWHAVYSVAPVGATIGDPVAKALAGGIVASLTGDGHVARPAPAK